MKTQTNYANLYMIMVEAAQLTGDVFILNEESGLLVEDIIPYLFGHPRIIMLDVSLQNKYSKS